jgi:hypothetical protein
VPDRVGLKSTSCTRVEVREPWYSRIVRALRIVHRFLRIHHTIFLQRDHAHCPYVYVCVCVCYRYTERELERYLC